VLWFSDLGTYLSHAHLLTLMDMDTATNAAQSVAQNTANTVGASAGDGPFDSLAKLLESTLTVRPLHNVNSVDVVLFHLSGTTVMWECAVGRCGH
jgi:hypothetical protein